MGILTDFKRTLVYSCFLMVLFSCANAQLYGSLRDLVIGGGAADVPAEVYKQVQEDWVLLSSQRTNARGGLVDMASPEEFTLGVYKIVFHPEEYYTARNISCFYPDIETQFEKLVDTEDYAIVTVMSPYGYSVYRGQSATPPPTFLN